MNAAASDLFHAAIEVCRKSTHVQLNDGVLIGSIELDETTSGVLAALYNAQFVIDVVENGKALSSQGISTCRDVVEYEIKIPSGQQYGGYIFSDIDGLLRSPDLYKKAPDSFYLVHEDIEYPKSSSELIEKYLLLTKIVGVLETLSTVDLGPRLCFLNRNRVDVDLRISRSELSRSQLERVNEICAELFPVDSDAHAERRREIFIGKVIEVAEAFPESERLAVILCRLDEIYARYRRDYELYAKDFSFSSLVADLDREKIEQAKRLGAVLHDVSAKLLAIPLAYILIAGQLVDDGGMRNHIIMVGAAVFALIMLTMITAQYVTLRHLKEDIDELKCNYLKKLDEQHVSGTYSQLTAKYRVQLAVLLIVAAVVIFVFFMAFNLYLEYTRVVWFERLLEWLAGMRSTQ
ncbi:MAG TPA: hypothetical protein VF275_03625 [Gammaproteobacteria bacterium]